MSVLVCPLCGQMTALEECDSTTLTSELFPGAELHRVHADCPKCGRYGVTYGDGRWDVPPLGLGLIADAEPSGMCALCAEPVKASHTRQWGPVVWTGWCEPCGAVSSVTRKRASRPPVEAHTSAPMAPLSPTWLDIDE